MKTAIRKPSFKNITTTYRGKTGCGCGCGGTYAAPEHADANDWTPQNDRTVKTRLNMLLKAMAMTPDEVRFMSWGDEDMWEYEYGQINESGDCRVLRIYATRD